ncbi:MAG TPA: hypothetical protein PLV58_06920, partial [Campylobacterales bacterium]|nr:hypothetical protein [Campylobacterales bacterium]
MKKVLFCFFLAASALLAVGNDFDIWLSDAVVTGKTVELNSEFMQAAGAGKQNLRKSFKHSFRAAFANTIDKIEPQKRRSTAAAFLSIVRASKYEVLMDNSNVAVYTLPVTATINFVNISNGELLYSQAYTHIATIETTKDDANIKTKIIKAYLETTDELITELANAAKTKFVPKRLSVKAIGIEHGMIILDKGLSGGIAEGDSLDGDGGALIKVKYSAQNYAVAKEELGKAKVGSVFTKTYSQSLEDIKKPKVTLLDIKYDDKKLTVSENMLYQFFAEKLAQKGSFALLPINKNFYTAINALQGSANLGIRFTKRAVPEYFMRLYIDGPYFYDAPTNVNYAKQRVYQTTICGEILDGSARVVGSDCKTEKILDEIKFGKAFSKEARFEVLAKNAAISLANEFASKVSFEPISYKVTGINNEAIELLDEKNLLSLGSTVTIFK